MLWNAHTKCWSKFKHPHCFWSNSMFLVNGGLDWEKGVQFWVGRGLSEAKPSHLAQRLHVLFLVESLLTLTASDPQSESSDDGVVCDQQGGGEHLWSLRPMIGPVRTTFRWNLSDQLSIYRTFDRFEQTVVYSRKGEQRCEWNKIRSEFLFLKRCVCSTTYIYMPAAEIIYDLSSRQASWRVDGAWQWGNTMYLYDDPRTIWLRP